MKHWQRVQAGTLRPGQVVDVNGVDTELTGWPRFDQQSQRWTLPTCIGFLTVDDPMVMVYR